MTDPDPAVAELEAIRGRFRFADDEVGLKVVRDIYGTDPTRRSPAGHIAASALDVPRLLAVAEAALKHHQPERITVWHACPVHEMTRTVTDPNRFEKMRGCPDCKPETVSDCSRCDEPWPCRERRDIAEALAGTADSAGAAADHVEHATEPAEEAADVN